MWGWKYLSWIRPFESSRAFLTLRLYKTPNAGVSTLKRPCAGVLTNLKSGREPFALAWHTPRGPIFEYFLLLLFVSKFSLSTSPSVSNTFLWPSGVHGRAQGKRSYICSQDAILSNLVNLTSLVFNSSKAFVLPPVLGKGADREWPDKPWIF